MTMLETLGRAHILVLHLPIGMLFFAAAFILFSKIFRKEIGKETRTALDFAIGLAAISAVVAAATGFVLHLDGDHDESLMGWHAWLGYATAAATLTAFLLRKTRFYRHFICFSAILAAAAGHFGGSLTHGEGWLFQVSGKKLAKNEVGATAVFSSKMDSTRTVFEAEVLPILREKCVSCHGPSKQKKGLRLDSADFVRRGTKKGPIISPESPETSPLLHFITLPEGDKKRMPPAGKAKLDEKELETIKNWILSGADFEKKSDKNFGARPEKMGQKTTVSIDFAPMKISFASPEIVVKVTKDHLASVENMGEGLPWLAVSFAGKTDFSSKNRTVLKKIGQQTAHLDASLAPLDDAALIDLLGEMPHLTRLNLSKTKISDASATAISRLEYLQSLNLTGCNFTDAGLKKLANGLPNLKQVFLWKSGATGAGIQFLKNKKPSLAIESGGAETEKNLPELKLKPPKFEFARTIFDDTVMVGLFFGMPQIDLFYTINGDEPTKNGQKFDGNPMVFDKTTRIRAIAKKDGWQSSEAIEANFIKRKWKPESAKLTRPASPKYPGNGAASLIDGTTADNHMDKAFLGFEGEHLGAILDFGKPINFTRLSAHFVENNGSWIFAPAGLAVWTSGDGKVWRPSFSKKYAAPASQNPNRAGVISEAAGETVECRFLKIRVENLLKNPSWHPGKGQKCWVFVDEIMVE